MNNHYRNIRSSKKYEELIPSPKFTEIDFGEGNTFFSLEKMKKMVLETLNDTKAISRVLEGNSLNETVKNIKEFLYWHIQYHQDGLEQNLFSPARTWADRKQGVDCKSYSIFAASILTNLGIDNSFRQIKQVSFNPDSWSHVYVVIPGTKFVIDGTVPYGHEPHYAEKNDLRVFTNALNGYMGLGASYCDWSCNTSTTTINNNNTSTNETNKKIEGSSLPYVDLNEIIAGTTDLKQSTSHTSDLESEPVLSSDDLAYRLRIAREKALAREPKIKQLVI